MLQNTIVYNVYIAIAVGQLSASTHNANMIENSAYITETMILI